jgi:uncharacterized protein YndB with AHSA1/START domain
MAEIIEKTESKLVVRSLLDASCEEVFAAWTDPASLRHWMCPSKVVRADVEVDLRVGGKLRVLMRSPEGDCDHRGEYLVIDPPHKLVFTWVSVNTGDQTTRVTVELAARGEGCELQLTHEDFPQADMVEKHSGGWSTIVDRLGAHLRWSTGGDLRMVLRYASPAAMLYEQFATEQGVRNWWLTSCEMDSRVGGRVALRFTKSDFYAIFRIARLEPDRAVEWECLESMQPEKLGFENRADWVGTRLRFEVEPLDGGQSQLAFTHVGLAPLECFGVCSNAWSFFLGQSLRAFLETGAGKPATP